jgi:type II secretory pathway pseudopilin PulG
MLVIGIIGLLAALAMPHLSGFTKGNAMKAATLQLLDDVTLARQRAMANRSMVCMVFLPANFWTNDSPLQSPPQSPDYFTTPQITNLAAHQYAAYALISMRTVGDQPGVSNVHYLTDWKFLPQGVYISPFQLTNGYGTNYIYTTNTLSGGLSNWSVWPVVAFTNNNKWFPFPSTFNASYGSNYGANCYNALPYIGFSPSGQLTAGADQFIMLTSGSIFCPLDPHTLLPQITWPASPPSLVETPPGNATNNPNLIHIDWLTAHARIERNQF